MGITKRDVGIASLVGGSIAAYLNRDAIGSWLYNDVYKGMSRQLAETASNTNPYVLDKVIPSAIESGSSWLQNYMSDLSRWGENFYKWNLDTIMSAPTLDARLAIALGLVLTYSGIAWGVVPRVFRYAGKQLGWTDQRDGRMREILGSAASKFKGLFTKEQID